MDGLIINQPFANLIIQKKKKWELRTRMPPEEKINSTVYLLSQGYILGKIKIKNAKGPFGSKVLKENYHLHRSSVYDVDDDFLCYAWEVDVCNVFDKPKKYLHPIGARVWVKNVLLAEHYLRSKLTFYM